MMKIGKVTCGLAVFGLFAMANMAQATEGGGSTYPGGTENYLAAAVPPPGFYVLEYGQMYTADAVKDNSGNTIPIPGFKLNVAVAATRLIWSTPNQVLGGNLVFHTILPLVNVSVGGSQTKVGLGDVTIGAGIAKHYSPELHTVMAVDAVLPTGAYDKNEAVNIGRNYYSLQPLYGLSYVQNSGFNGDFKLTFNLNSQNSATNYTSGNEVFVDYAAGYGLGNGWVVGVGGYMRQQFSDDSGTGAPTNGNRAKAFAFGPSIKYENANHWFITAKLTQETGVQNATQGTALWVKAAVPF